MATKKARFLEEAGPGSGSPSAGYPAVTAPQPRPLPEERAHMPQQSGQQCWAVWRATMARYLPRVSRRVNHAKEALHESS